MGTVVRAMKSGMVLIALLAAATAAHADTRDPTAADALFRQAREAMKQGDFAAAYPKLAESYRLDPAVGTTLNLAQCEHRLGKVASAMTHYKESLEQLTEGDPRLKVARDGLAELEPRVPKLTLKLPADAPPGTIIVRDDVELGTAIVGIPLPVDPGEHVIATRAPGRKQWRRMISINEAESKELIAEIGPVEVTAQPELPVVPQPVRSAPASSERAPDRADQAGSLKSVGYVMGAAGLLGLGVGTWFTLKARSLDEEATAHEHFHPDPAYVTGYYCDAVCSEKTADSRNASKIGYVGLIGGGALVVGGVAMILLAPSARGGTKGPAVKVSVGPTSLHLGGAW